MRPFLFTTKHFSIGTYPALILCAAIAAIATLAWRTRKRTDIDHAVLFRTLPIAIASGWVLSATVLSWSSGFSFTQFFANLSPASRSGQTITFFGAGAGIVAVLLLIPQGRGALRYLDAMAPSFPVGLAFAKTACFLAGCCAGTVCELPVGVTFPFGSDAYAAQWKAGRVSPPDALVYQPDERDVRLLGHTQAIQAERNAPNNLMLEHAAKHGTTVNELVTLASSTRSLPVWPVQPAYIVGALLLWAVSERLFKHAPFDGAAAAAVLVGYGSMRVAFDFYVEGLEPVWLALSVPQWSGLAAVVVGASIGVFGLWTGESMHES